jgi:hypothetical protein
MLMEAARRIPGVRFGAVCALWEVYYVSPAEFQQQWQVAGKAALPPDPGL